MPRLGGVTSDGNGQAVIGVVLMGLGQNTRVVAGRVTAAVQEINKTLPPGVKIAPYYNRADLIDRVLGTVAHNLAEGAILVIAVLFLLLGNLRAGLIVAARHPAFDAGRRHRHVFRRPVGQSDEPGRDRFRPAGRWCGRDDRERRAPPRRVAAPAGAAGGAGGGPRSRPPCHLRRRHHHRRLSADPQPAGDRGQDVPADGADGDLRAARLAGADPDADAGARELPAQEKGPRA